MRSLQIENTIIDDNSDAFVIAEVGHNHQGNVDLCEQIFVAAAKAGASAVKLQKRENKVLYTREFYDSPYTGPTSYGETYGEHREFLEFGNKEYVHLQKVAKELGLIFFATAFDIPSAEFLFKLDMPVIKVASGDLRSSPLLKFLSKNNTPLILSTGGAEMKHVAQALEDVDPSKVGLLQCTAAYPADAEEMDLRVIETFRKDFPNTVVGLSSHDRGIAFPVAAYALGARIIEKHFTLDRSMKGTDHAFSLEPSGMEKMIRDLKLTRLALGNGIKRQHEREANGIRKMGKMLVYGANLDAGTLIKDSDFKIVSPNDGISPQEIKSLVGKRISRSVKADEIVTFEDFLD